MREIKQSTVTIPLVEFDELRQFKNEIEKGKKAWYYNSFGFFPRVIYYLSEEELVNELITKNESLQKELANTKENTVYPHPCRKGANGGLVIPKIAFRGGKPSLINYLFNWEEWVLKNAYEKLT